MRTISYYGLIVPAEPMLTLGNGHYSEIRPGLYVQYERRMVLVEPQPEVYERETVIRSGHTYSREIQQRVTAPRQPYYQEQWVVIGHSGRLPNSVQERKDEAFWLEHEEFVREFYPPPPKNPVIRALTTEITVTKVFRFIFGR